MTRETCTVAIALDLFEPRPWHQEIYAGTQQFAQESGRWRCVIDEFPEVELSRRRPRPGRYDGVIARVNQPSANCARRLKIPLVKTWFSSPVRQVVSVFPDLAGVGRLCADHLAEHCSGDSQSNWDARQPKKSAACGSVSQNGCSRNRTRPSSKSPVKPVSAMQSECTKCSSATSVCRRVVSGRN